MMITDKDLALKNTLSHIFPISQQQLYIFHINKNIALNIKHKCQDSKNPGTINANDETVELLLHNNKVGDNFNLNSLVYTNARDYLVLDNVLNTPANVYKLWKVIIFITTEESFSFA